MGFYLPGPSQNYSISIIICLPSCCLPRCADYCLPMTPAVSSSSFLWPFFRACTGLTVPMDDSTFERSVHLSENLNTLNTPHFTTPLSANWPTDVHVHPNYKHFGRSWRAFWTTRDAHVTFNVILCYCRAHYVPLLVPPVLLFFILGYNLALGT